MKKILPYLILFTSFLGLSCNVLGTIIYEEQVVIELLKLLRYFTILSNVLVFTYFLNKYIFKHNNLDNYLGGITVYITVTFIVFCTMLEATYNPSNGFYFLASLCNHYITPLLTITFVVFAQDEIKFHNSSILKWLYFPITYLLFLTIHGMITDNYLYPFFQINEVGILGFLIMVIFLVVAFLILEFLLVKIVSKRQSVKVLSKKL